MIEIIPQLVDSAFLYFHRRCSSGDEMRPFANEIRLALPNTYIWAGDGCIEGGFTSRPRALCSAVTSTVPAWRLPPQCCDV
jgi:hypothetical protein